MIIENAEFLNEINPADELDNPIQSQGNDEGIVQKTTPKRASKKTPKKTPKKTAKTKSSLTKKIPKTTLKRKGIKKAITRKSARLVQQNKEVADASGTRSLLSESDDESFSPTMSFHSSDSESVSFG